MKMRTIFVVSLLGLVLLNPAFAKVYSVNDVEDMIKEIETAKIETGKAEMAKTALEEEEKRLVAVKELLNGAVENMKKEINKHNEEAKKQHIAVDNYNARCSGIYSDPNYVAQCKADARPLKDWKNRVDERARSINIQKSMIDNRIKDLNQSTLRWADKARSNAAQLNDLYAKQEELVQKIRLLMTSPLFVMDLKVRPDLGQECREAKSLEDAHRCLRMVWDGAK